MNGLTPMENSPLAGKRICALGSSVTYGESAFQQAVGEYIAVRLDATLTKEAVSGTTLADLDDTSYVSCRILPSNALCTVEGNLSQFEDGYLLVKNIDIDVI